MRVSMPLSTESNVVPNPAPLCLWCEKRPVNRVRCTRAWQQRTHPYRESPAGTFWRDYCSRRCLGTYINSLVSPESRARSRATLRAARALRTARNIARVLREIQRKTGEAFPLKTAIEIYKVAHRTGRDTERHATRDRPWREDV